VVLEVDVRDLVFASWEVAPDEIAERLPDGLAPELADGRALLTLSIARTVGGRLGRIPVPRFAKLTLHTYVIGEAGPGLCFLDARVSRSTFGRRFVGIPFRSTRIRARRGLADAPVLRVSMRYEHDGAAEPPELESGRVGSHNVAYFEHAGLFRVVASHDPIAWQRATLVDQPSFGTVTELGFDVGAPSSVLYAERVSFRAELPPVRV
jgi:uncharacterized protein YqjF (DUF2071 family)